MNNSNIREILPLGIILINVIISFFTLLYGPENLPSHWAINGSIDSYDNSESIIMLPIFSIIIYVLFTFFQKRPQYCNFPKPFRNKETAYKIMADFAYSIKVITIILLSYFTICSALCISLNIFISLSIIIIDIITMIYYISKLSKA